MFAFNYLFLFFIECRSRESWKPLPIFEFTELAYETLGPMQSVIVMSVGIKALVRRRSYRPCKEGRSKKHINWTCRGPPASRKLVNIRQERRRLILNSRCTSLAYPGHARAQELVASRSGTAACVTRRKIK